MMRGFGWINLQESLKIKRQERIRLFLIEIQKYKCMKKKLVALD